MSTVTADSIQLDSIVHLYHNNRVFNIPIAGATYLPDKIVNDKPLLKCNMLNFALGFFSVALGITGHTFLMTVVNSKKLPFFNWASEFFQLIWNACF